MLPKYQRHWPDDVHESIQEGCPLWPSIRNGAELHDDITVYVYRPNQPREEMEKQGKKSSRVSTERYDRGDTLPRNLIESIVVEAGWPYCTVRIRIVGVETKQWADLRFPKKIEPIDSGGRLLDFAADNQETLAIIMKAGAKLITGRGSEILEPLVESAIDKAIDRGGDKIIDKLLNRMGGR